MTLQVRDLPDAFIQVDVVWTRAERKKFPAEDRRKFEAFGVVFHDFVEARILRDKLVAPPSGGRGVVICIGLTRENFRSISIMAQDQGMAAVNLVYGVASLRSFIKVRFQSSWLAKESNEKYVSDEDFIERNTPNSPYFNSVTVYSQFNRKYQRMGLGVISKRKAFSFMAKKKLRLAAELAAARR